MEAFNFCKRANGAWFKASFAFLIIFIFGCNATENESFLNDLNQVNVHKSALNPSSLILDNFNDGIINSIWSMGASEKADVYEDNGALNIKIGSGQTPSGRNQVGGIDTKDYILQGDFDIQLDFQVCFNYHSIGEGNTKLMLVDRENDGLEISIRTGRYMSIEVPALGSGIIKNSTFTDHLTGKLRIVRKSNLITTFFWEDGWRKHAEWETQYVSGNLKITFNSWNWAPDFSAFDTKFDNVTINKGLIPICHKPGTIGQKQLILPAEAVGANLANGDFIGWCK